MLCRGYGYAARPTIYSKLRPGPVDWIVIACILGGITVLAYLKWKPL